MSNDQLDAWFKKNKIPYPGLEEPSFYKDFIKEFNDQWIDKLVSGEPQKDILMNNADTYLRKETPQFPQQIKLKQPQERTVRTNCTIVDKDGKVLKPPGRMWKPPTMAPTRDAHKFQVRNPFEEVREERVDKQKKFKAQREE